MSERDVLPSSKAEGYRIHLPVHDRPGSSSGQKRTISSSFAGRNLLQGQSLSRRRVFSMDAPNGNGNPVRSRRVSATPWGSVQEPEPAMSIFSDEFDLSHEDPRILQDVQRAVHLKARREARLMSGQLHPDGQLRPGFHSRTIPDQTHVFPRQASSSQAHEEVDIDFSPSTGGGAKFALHPVPTSLDDGHSLDWSVPGSDEDKHERRWSLSVSRRKSKERAPQITASALEKQEKQYASKLARIRTIASPHTLRKVEITTDQLNRRYNLIHNSFSADNKPFDIAKVVRWYSGQKANFRSALEKAEPFTWLKHLDRRGTGRLPWHLSALIMEEYVQAHRSRIRAFEPIDSSPNLSLSPDRPRPSFSHTSSILSISPYSNRSRPDGRVSFEPFIESARPSIDVESRNSGDSAYSSTFTGSSHPQMPAMSPASSRIHVRDYATRSARHNQDSDDNSSTRRSLSENKKHSFSSIRQPDNDSLTPSVQPTLVAVPHQADDNSVHTRLATPDPPITIESPSSITVPSVTDAETTSNLPKRAIDRRMRRTSLPAVDRLSTILEQTRQQEAEEAKLEEEYFLKAELLKETTAQNSRIRQLLNRVSNQIREYETVQIGLARVLDVSYKGLPQELLEAFSHDPAAVTGATRRWRGHQAVDDIHNRLLRQRQIFHNFLQHETDAGIFPVSEGILTDPVNSLLQSLQSLNDIREDIYSRSKEVTEVLANVQSVHAQVKAEYNDTLSHTSVVYPELSYIVALEESYKDQYQQFWELGMDALTFFLDTVTPFWRTYGKVIGDDLQEFLIIPLYRNEFTGEAKRYPILHVPRRSFRHWVGLVFLFYTSIAVCILQARTAITSTNNLGLSFITSGLRWLIRPFFWIGIVIQWAAVLTEIIVVLTQLYVLFWWLGWSVKLFT